jgi:transketolase C-terminal domain/subunit
VFSPSDWARAAQYVDETFKPGIRYLRFDAKPVLNIDSPDAYEAVKGFRELKKGDDTVLLSTGFMSQRAVSYALELDKEGISVGVIDIFLPSSFDHDALSSAVQGYTHIISLEEGIGGAGGLDSKVLHFINSQKLCKKFTPLAMNGQYSFEIGSRDFLHKHFGMDLDSVLNIIGSER